MIKKLYFYDSNREDKIFCILVCGKLGMKYKEKPEKTNKQSIHRFNDLQSFMREYNLKYYYVNINFSPQEKYIIFNGSYLLKNISREEFKTRIRYDRFDRNFLDVIR